MFPNHPLDFLKRSEPRRPKEIYGKPKHAATEPYLLCDPPNQLARMLLADLKRTQFMDIGEFMRPRHI
jgi:hypothetical protein